MNFFVTNVDTLIALIWYLFNTTRRVDDDQKNLETRNQERFIVNVQSCVTFHLLIRFHNIPYQSLSRIRNIDVFITLWRTIAKSLNESSVKIEGTLVLRFALAQKDSYRLNNLRPIRKRDSSWYSDFIWRNYSIIHHFIRARFSRPTFRRIETNVPVFRSSITSTRFE